jgi:3-hydroxyisobutyrate dehydrogenase
MGSGMAANIAQSDNDLIVFDAFEQATAPFKDRGITVAASIGELVQQADVVFTSLPGPPQVEEVVLGPGGVLETGRAGLAYFDLTSNSHELVLRLSQQLAEAGISMLDAPVSGGPAGAASGQLVVWAGGDREVFDRHVGVLKSFSSASRYVGGIGSGTVTKLTHNLLGNMIFAALAEVFTLGTKAGLDPLDLWEAMKLGVVGKTTPLDHLGETVSARKVRTPGHAAEAGAQRRGPRRRPRQGAGRAASPLEYGLRRNYRSDRTRLRRPGLALVHEASGRTGRSRNRRRPGTIAAGG